MVRRGTGLDPDQAWRQLLEERQDVTPLQLPADDDLMEVVVRTGLAGLHLRLESTSQFS